MKGEQTHDPKKSRRTFNEDLGRDTAESAHELARNGTRLWNTFGHNDVEPASRRVANVRSTNAETQSRWLRDWMENVSTSTGNATEIQKQVQQGQDLLLSWTEAQRQFW